MPEAVIIAGANGAGKTTFARSVIPGWYTQALFLNTDEIQRERPDLKHPVAAGREMLRRLDTAVANKRSFVVETTLASRMYVQRIPAWKTIGYTVELHYIEVPDADFAVKRVAQRVALGGARHP